MIEYKLLGKNDSPITIDNFEEVSETIKSAFPEMAVETRDMERSKRLTVGYNGNTFHAYCGIKGSQIFIPKQYNSLIKSKLESTGLKCL
jgi:hypothetical protein